MALELLRFPGFKDGDKALSVAVTANYVGGMPMAAYADGVAGSLTGHNYLGMALSDRSADAEIGKVGLAPRGSEGILRPSFSPTLDKLIIASGVSAGDASLGFSNNKLFAQQLFQSGADIGTDNPQPTFLDPTALGVTKVYPYDNSKTYTPGNLMYVNATSGLWTNAAGDAEATPLAHGVVSAPKVGDALQMYTF